MLLKNKNSWVLSKLEHQGISQYKNSIIYGVFKEQSLLYAVELKNNRIVQVKGYSNKNIGDEDMRVVREWVNKF